MTGSTLTTEEFDRLLEAARGALANSHSPYSGLRVGAALLAQDGSVHAGCNVESASYGLTICAERNAAFRAVADGARGFSAVVITTDRDGALMPCGACRQILHELEPGLEVVVVGADGDRVDSTIAELLPSAIGEAEIKGEA
jgi:cytidine deaminase